MILLTGGAGCIGSNLHAALSERSREAIIVDRLGANDKWRNLAHHPPARIIAPEALADFLDRRPPLELVCHLGAVSDTTARDGDLVWETNVELSLRLWEWCTEHHVRFIYASSAATYGDGSAGFEDDPTPSSLARLRPLNLYGWSKHAFDLRVATLAAQGLHPPQWVGLKFFNVYGPNERHKGRMESVVKAKFDELMAEGSMRLFRSGRSDIADGEQRRDFIWVDDVVDVLLWLIDRPTVQSGIYNVGTGRAETYRALAEAVATAAGKEPSITFIPMPADLAAQYQYRTEASLRRLRAQGYTRPFAPLAEGVRQYVQGFLLSADPYR